MAEFPRELHFFKPKGGKSTVMSLIQRFYDPQEGGVFIGKAQLNSSATLASGAWEFDQKRGRDMEYP